MILNRKKKKSVNETKNEKKIGEKMVVVRQRYYLLLNGNENPKWEFSFSCLAHQFKNSSHNWFCSVFLIKENDGNCLAIARDQNLGSLFILLDQAHMNEWNRNWLSLKILPSLWTCQPIDQGLYIWTHYSF